MPENEEAETLWSSIRPLIDKAVPYILSAVIAFFSTAATHNVEGANDQASHNKNAEQVQAVRAALDEERKERQGEIEQRRKERDAQIRQLEDRVKVLEAIVDRLERRR